MNIQSLVRIGQLAGIVLCAGALAVGNADAAGGRGGGGGGGHGGGGGGGRPQVNNARADPRTNNVRSASVNNVNNVNRSNTNVRNTNVNVNRDVNVHVDNHGCCGGGWDDDWHPVATAAAVTATVAVTSAVIGSMVRTLPPACVPVNYGGMIYQQCGATWYVPQSGQYVVVAAPY